MSELNTRQKGTIGEDLAEKYLQSEGYTILGRNLNCRYGEIDLVARKKNNLYFVEIRRRVGNSYGSALESISTMKMRRIRKAAEYFLFQNKDWQKLAPYFSVIAIDEDPERPDALKIEFLPDAFG